MRPAEHDANPVSTPKTGLFATLRASLPVKGTGAPSRAPRRRRLLAAALVVLATAVALAVVASLAFASGPPQAEKELAEETVNATRAHLVVDVVTEGLNLKWHAEYITAQKLKEAEEKKETAQWMAAASGTSEQTSDDIYLGADFPLHSLGASGVLHHLEPGTAYDARFIAENSAGSDERTFTFTTTAVTKPEIAEIFESGHVTSTTFSVQAASPTSATAEAQIETNGAETKYAFEYAPAEGPNGQSPAEGSSAWVPFEPAGTVTVAEDFAVAAVKVTGLAPETKYYARVKATNEEGTVTQRTTKFSDGSFTTPTEKPVAFAPELRNLTGVSVHLSGEILPHGLETTWRFEYALSARGPWTPVTGAEGIVTLMQAEALPEGTPTQVEGSLTGLSPSKVYYLRLFAKSAAGEGLNGSEEPILAEKQGITSFETFGAPREATTFAVHGLDGEALRVMGSVNPNSVPTSGEQTITVEGAPTGGTFTLTFKGQTTTPIAFDAPAEGPNGVGRALAALSTIGGESSVIVTGPAGGPYTVYFGNEGGPLAEKAQPQIEADASGLTPSPAAAVKVAIVEVGGEGYVTHYHFDYVSQKQFEAPGGEGGFARASSTPDVELGSGDSTEYVGAALPALIPGESYRFRLVATNTSPGDPVVRGEEQSLTDPVPPAVAPEAGGGCPNESLRTGLSALLPDCRAFEQLTPVDKEGAQEIFNYGGTFGTEGVALGEDGDHLEYASTTVKYGAGPTAGQSPYFFSRNGTGWQMTAGSTQPEAGVDTYIPQVFSSDLSGFAFQASFGTSPLSQSSHTEFRAGPPGGPYTTVASVPSAESEPGWVAASGDFSKLVLQVADHTLLGHSTHTREGEDLYEYSGGQLRQLNVTGPAPGVTIGTCGATIANGGTGLRSGVSANTDRSHAVSQDGLHVFFEAVPTGEGCSEAKHLYVRVNGAETVDLGVYTFVAANAEGSSVLLEKRSGVNPGLYLYRAGSSPEFLPSSGVAITSGASESNLTVSENLSTVYIRAGEITVPTLYRYDVAGKSLLFVSKLSAGDGRTFYASSPDGRYLYFIAESVAGLPGGGIEHYDLEGHEAERQTSQVYRYDSTEEVLQCMSCASTFDTEPRLSALFTQGEAVTASADGDYVFFDTPAALLLADVDGEIAPEGVKAEGGEHSSMNYSLSSDVYEWRKDGVAGCSHAQGCLALITSGHGGFLNTLLGATSTGGDVFFATKESLVTADNDSAEDIYDARVDGGFPEPSKPVECKGDSCSTPFAPPGEVTPSSSTFQGPGNPAPSAAAPAVKKKTVAKKKPKKKAHKKKKVKKSSKKAKKSAKGRK